MIERLGKVTVLVRDQDEALRFYRDALGMEVHEDRRMGEYRWLTVAPAGSPVAIVLQRPGAPFHSPELTEELLGRVGQGTTWVLETSDCRGTAAALQSKGVRFRSEPEEMPWGISAVFEDLYGNPFNLLQVRPH
jgi:predicted enzyme related to lactoylglutathione lyase